MLLFLFNGVWPVVDVDVSLVQIMIGDIVGPNSTTLRKHTGGGVTFDALLFLFDGVWRVVTVGIDFVQILGDDAVGLRRHGTTN